jgi:hypothetical protein
MATKTSIERRIEKMEYPDGKKDIQTELLEYQTHISVIDKKVAVVIGHPAKSDTQIRKEALALYEEYGAYQNFLHRERKPLPQEIRQKLDAVYGPSKTAEERMEVKAGLQSNLTSTTPHDEVRAAEKGALNKDCILEQED